jgi:hypothetical protein
MAFPPKVVTPPSGVAELPNSPLWPPSPSSAQAASPGPQPKGSAPPPPPSNTQDNYAHHSSPTPGNVQTPIAPRPSTNTLPPKKNISKMPDVPMHITKHPNPVGRPKNPRS